MTALQQFSNCGGADDAGSAGDENAHWRSMCAPGATVNRPRPLHTFRGTGLAQYESELATF
jgi:hypothetical protein